MIDRFSSLWLFGRVYGEDRYDETSLDRPGTPDYLLYSRARRLFFEGGFSALLSSEKELESLFDTYPELLSFLGYAHIYYCQYSSPFIAEIRAWKKGLEYFNRGLKDHPECLFFYYDAARARAVLGDTLSECPEPSDPDGRYSFIYYRLFLILSPLVQVPEEYMQDLLDTGSLPDGLFDMAKALMADALTPVHKKKALLALCDLYAVEEDYRTVLELLECEDAALREDPDIQCFIEQASILCDDYGDADGSGDTESIDDVNDRPNVSDIPFLEDTLKLNPYCREAYEGLCEIYIATKNTAAAFDICAAMAELRPWNHDVFSLLTELLLGLELYQDRTSYRNVVCRGLVLIIRFWELAGRPDYALGIIIGLLSRLYHSWEYGDDCVDPLDGTSKEQRKLLLSQITSYLDIAGEDTRSNPDFLAYTGFELYINHVPLTGEQFLRDTLSLDPSHAYALQCYGVVLEEQGLTKKDAAVLEEACRHFQRAIENEKDPFTRGRYILYFIDFLPTAGMERLLHGYLQKAIAEKLPVPELYERMVDEYSRLSRDDEAMEILTEGLDRFPGNEELSFRLGKELVREGNYAGGIEVLVSLTGTHPEESLYWNQLGICHIDWGNSLISPEDAFRQYRSGIAAFTKALAIHPESALFFGNRGDAFRLLGDYEKGIEDLYRAIALSPDDPFNYQCLAKIYWEQGLRVEGEEQDDFIRKAESGFRKAQTLNPDNCRCFQDLADMYYHFGFFSDAIDYYRKALELDADLYEVYDSVGLCYYHMKEFGEALEWFTLGLDFAKNPGDILNSIGLCYFEQENFETAQEFFMKASNSDPENPVFLDNLLLTQYKILGYGESGSGE